eukprot:m.53000 g.53000  ORF g.53000 m.53000 type:complete len:111 (+) comp10833_c0_seq4:139-471(+)
MTGQQVTPLVLPPHAMPMNGHLNPNHTILTRELPVPIEAVGSIIGKGGSHISHIRQQSQALIKIQDSVPGNPARLVTISGTPRAVDVAQAMIRERLLTHVSRLLFIRLIV